MELEGLTSADLWPLAVPGFLAAHLLLVLVTGRVPARSITPFAYAQTANRRDTPALYWLIVLVNVWVVVAAGWWTAQSAGLADQLPPGFPAAADRAAPWAAAATFGVYVVVAFALSRRRRARLRALPSVIERASSGV